MSADRQVDPQAYYTASDLKFKLGINVELIEQAHASGALKAIDIDGPARQKRVHRIWVATYAGSGIPAPSIQGLLFKGEDVIAWLHAGAPARKDKAGSASSTPRTVSHPGARINPIALPNPTKQTRSTTMAEYADPIGEFDARVKAKMKEGVKRERAVYAVTRADPDLHRAYIVATNERMGKKAAVAHLR